MTSPQISQIRSQRPTIAIPSATIRKKRLLRSANPLAPNTITTASTPISFQFQKRFVLRRGVEREAEDGESEPSVAIRCSAPPDAPRRDRRKSSTNQAKINLDKEGDFIPGPRVMPAKRGHPATASRPAGCRHSRATRSDAVRATPNAVIPECRQAGSNSQRRVKHRRSHRSHSLPRATARHRQPCVATARCNGPFSSVVVKRYL